VTYLLLFFLHPEALDIFQGLAGSLGHQFPYDKHVGDAHKREEEECAGGRGVFQHPGGELPDKIGTDPQRKSGDGHGQPPYPCGVHLREEYEDHRADGACREKDIGQEASQQKGTRHAQRFAFQEVNADKDQGYDHARNADIDQFLPSDPVYDQQGEHRGPHVDQADQCLVEQGVAAREPAGLEDGGAIIQHGVHAHKLSQDGDGGTDQYRAEDTRGEEQLPVRFHFRFQHLSGLVDLKGYFRGPGVDFG